MPRIRDTAFPLANYAAQTYTLPSSPIPSNATALALSIRRSTEADPTIWPSKNVKVAVSLDLSLDNGQTWTFFSGYTAEGGILKRKDGTDVEDSYVVLDLPPSAQQRRVRGSLTISGGTLRSEGFLDVVTPD